MNNDGPFWMTAKRDSICAECEADIHKGDRFVWDRLKVNGSYCCDCGEEIAGEDSYRKSNELL